MKNHSPALISSLACALPALGAEPGALAGAGGLSLNVAQVMAAEPAPGSKPPLAYGDADPQRPFTEGWLLTIHGGLATDFSKARHGNAGAALTKFFADRLEIGLEIGAWYIGQEGEDTGAASVQLITRVHFLPSEIAQLFGDDHALSWEQDHQRQWTMFLDLGIGGLFSGDDVPDGGTSANFLPRAGLGATYRLSERWRLIGALRWHHVSNARTNGDGRNPNINGVMLMLGVQVAL